MLELTTDADVVRLDEDILDLSTLDCDGVPLASLVAQHGPRVKLGVHGSGKIACWVAEEADAAAAVFVE